MFSNPGRVYRWKRLDGATLELLRLTAVNDGFRATSTLLAATKHPFRASYTWLLDRSWRTRSLAVDVSDESSRLMVFERRGDNEWLVNGEPRPDLAECEELDLSITPFCNTLALTRLDLAAGAAGELTALYVTFPDLDCSPSRQRYERTGERRFKYIDLGAHRGFEASLDVDADGLVECYEGVFELIDETRARDE